MRGKIAREIRQFLKQEQGVDVSYRRMQTLGVRGEKIGELTVQRLIDGLYKEELVPMMQFRNPEKNFYRNIKRKYTKKEV